jgi:catechol 2,3-dioxygenase-like lactoylglutathione lyase family enzyme
MPARVLCVTFDCRDPALVAAFWATALGYEEVPPEEAGWVMIADPTGSGPSLYFAPVPEPKVVKNRAHLDIGPETTMAAEVERLVGAGASAVETLRHDTWAWTVMQDPEGNEFCVAEPVNGQP